MDIDTALSRFLRNVAAVRSVHTTDAYRYGVRMFKLFLIENGIPGNSPTDKLTADLFIQYPAWLASYKPDGKKRLSRKTVGVYASAAKGLLDNFVIDGIFLPTYQEGVRLTLAFRQLYKKREDKMPRFPKPEDAYKMLEAVHSMNEASPRLERNIALIEFLVSSGCRNAETIGLSLRDVDLRNRTAIVTGKGSKQRTVFFSSDAKDAIKKYWMIAGISNPADPAFCRHDKGAGTKTHKRMTTATTRNIVHDVAVLAGIDPALFTPHYFRHDFAIKMLRSTNNLAMVQDMMGHASPQSTRVYAKIYPDELQKAHRELYG